MSRPDHGKQEEKEQAPLMKRNEKIPKQNATKINQELPFWVCSPKHKVGLTVKSQASATKLDLGEKKSVTLSFKLKKSISIKITMVFS